MLGEGDVNTEKPGVYELVYQWTDAAGNVADPVTRTITVVDNTKPLISLIGPAEVFHEAGQPYEDAGAYWSDLVEGEGVVIPNGQVDVQTPGVYSINFEFADANGNAADPVTRTVTVADTIPPQITLMGNTHVVLEVGDEFVGAGAEWSDSLDGEGILPGKNTGVLDLPGVVSLAFDYEDAAGNAAHTVYRYIHVIDRIEMVENLPVRSVITEVTTLGNSQPGVVYHLSSADKNADNPLFHLDQNGTLSNKIRFDYEKDDTNYTIGVVASNDDGYHAEAEFIIHLINQFEDLDQDGVEDAYDQDIDGDGFSNKAEIAYGSDPYDPASVENTSPQALQAATSLSISENKGIGSVVGSFDAKDLDGDTLVYTLIDNINTEVFEINSTTGVLTSAKKFDYESDPIAYQITVRVADQWGAFSEAQFEVEITDLYEPDGNNYFVTSASDMEMIWVGPGTFLMGSLDVTRPWEPFQREVTLSNGFYLGKFELTEAQYLAVMEGSEYSIDTSSFSSESDVFPVLKLNWYDASAFVAKLNEREEEAGRLQPGWQYVLHTEAEWEYACRAGTLTNYFWGDEYDPSWQ